MRGTCSHPRGQTYAEAACIVRTLQQVGYSGDLHLIGHSLGGEVATEVARLLCSEGGTHAKASQITLLDSPFANIPLAPTYVLDWPNGFVDNYYSDAGLLVGNIAGAYNYFLVYGFLDHSYAHEWYYDTVIDDWRAEGFYWSKAGGGWQDIPRPNSQWQVPRWHNEVFSSLVGGIKSFGNVITKIGETGEEVVTLIKGSPAYAWMDVAVPSDARWMSLDFRFVSPGSGDYLQVQLADSVVFIYVGTDFSAEGYLNTGMLDVTSFAGQTARLLLALNDVGTASCRD